MLGALLLVLAASACSGSEFSASSSGGSGGTLGGGAAGQGGAAPRGGAGAGSLAGASHAGSSAAGAPEGGADNGGAADDAGAGGEGGALGLAGSGGTLGDSGAAGAGDAGACTASQWFPDGDGDDYGRTTAQVEACVAPTAGKWVSHGGDCNDDDALVFPKEKDFKSTGYAVTGGVSFDYDCSGQEEPDPTALGAAPACSSVLACTGSGFAGTGRTGVGVNPLCGSKTLVTCMQEGLACKAVQSQVPEGLRCR